MVEEVRPRPLFYDHGLKPSFRIFFPNLSPIDPVLTPKNLLLNFGYNIHLLRLDIFIFALSISSSTENQLRLLDSCFKN